MDIEPIAHYLGPDKKAQVFGNTFKRWPIPLLFSLARSACLRWENWRVFCMILASIAKLFRCTSARQKANSTLTQKELTPAA